MNSIGMRQRDVRPCVCVSYAEDTKRFSGKMERVALIGQPLGRNNRAVGFSGRKEVKLPVYDVRVDALLVMGKVSAQFADDDGQWLPDEMQGVFLFGLFFNSLFERSYDGGQAGVIGEGKRERQRIRFALMPQNAGKRCAVGKGMGSAGDCVFKQLLSAFPLIKA